MHVDEFRKRLEDLKVQKVKEDQQRIEAERATERERRNWEMDEIIHEEVDILFGRVFHRSNFPRASSERRCDYSDYVSEGWLFLLGTEGQAVLSKAKTVREPWKYTVKAVYRRLLRLASKEYGFGRYNKQPKFRQMDEQFWEDYDSPYSSDKCDVNEIDLADLLCTAAADVQKYLKAKIVGMTNVEFNAAMHEAKGSPRTRRGFAHLREWAHDWIGHRFPEEVAAVLNATLSRQFLSEIDRLYRTEMKADSKCSILFIPDHADWVLYGPLSEVISRKVDRPVGPGPRLCLPCDRMGEVVLEHFERSQQPDDGRDGGHFLLYSVFDY